MERNRLAFPRLPQSTKLAHQRPQDQRRFHAFALEAEQDSQCTLRVAGGRRFRELKNVVARAVTDRPQHQFGGDAVAVGKQRQLLQFLLARPARFPSTRSTMSCAAAGSRSRCSALARARSHPGSAAVSTGRIGTQTPCLFHRADPWRVAGLAIEIVGDHQAQHVGGRTRRNVDERGRTLVGLAARHTQLEKTPLGKQRKRLAAAWRTHPNRRLRSMKKTVRSA